ncbi:DNA-damage-inducible protein F [Paenibacillus terrae HPL-003]|uniref:DNA-damage-inducible protein F n=1 Tax=Paenibacillus terrae (strain HPL-003) TaxID=985665 RepID=G7VU90_PAETH|nr:MATE family efflux transporter [Paenibacillus terrae]AET60906.1 DNA-damage-inducible protein F [Paenibacillus terrae HPL-003]
MLPSHRAYLALAIPLIISTITTPLLGAVDTAVIGHLSHSAYLGGVAVGTLIFNTLYWLFGFLRVSTSAFTAQATGAKNNDQGIAALMRPLAIALLIGALFILLQKPILLASLQLIHPAEDVAAQASIYFNIRIWGAPLTLVNYVLLGWLMGLSRVKATLFLQISMNVINMVLAIVFTQIMQWDVAGVAGATLIAEVLACVLGFVLVLRSSVWREWKRSGKRDWRGWFGAVELKSVMATNLDLMIRTACLLTMFNLFTSRSAGFGTDQLAANAILLQIHYLMAYFFDGFANASSIMTGQARGARDQKMLQRVIHLSWFWTIVTSVLTGGLYFALKEPLIRLFTDNATVISLTDPYNAWLVAFPLAAGLGLVFYGVFTGMTVTYPIRNSMLISLVFFLIALFWCVPHYGNHGLWLSFIVFALGRSLFLVIYLPRLQRI